VDPPLHIGSSIYHKTGIGTFKIPLERLEALRFNDVPYYSTVEIVAPGENNPDLHRYRLSISATHGGGPTNEDFSIMFHVGFGAAGVATDPATRRLCDRRADRVRRVFRPLVSDGGFDNGGGGNDSRYYFEGSWYVDVLYSKRFTRQ
jgi:hypothetical protein